MSLPDGNRLLILDLLVRFGELTGADMLEHEPSLPRGTIYTTLLRLDKQKLVTSRRERSKRQSGPPRRYYTITALGQRVHQAAMAGQAVLAAV